MHSSQQNPSQEAVRLHFSSTGSPARLHASTRCQKWNLLKFDFTRRWFQRFVMVRFACNYHKVLILVLLEDGIEA